MVSAIESVTVGVSSLEAALAVFRDTLGLRLESDTRASVNVLSAWRLPAHADVRLVELSADGHPFGRIRLAVFEQTPSIATRRDHGPNVPDLATDVGPKALDFYTGSPVDKGLEKLESVGCRRRSEPIRYRVGEVETEEVVLDGPDEVPMLLMVGHSHDQRIMRRPMAAGRFSELATVSVVTADLEASRRFYGEVLGLATDLDVEVPDSFRDPVCRLTGVAPGTRIHLAVFRDADEPSGKILLAHFFSATTGPLAHPMSPGQLGINLFTLRCDDLDELESRVRAQDFEILARPSHVGLGDGAPARLMMVRGPNLELLEFVERAG